MAETGDDMQKGQADFGNSWATVNRLIELRRPAAAGDARAAADRFAIIETVQTYGWAVDERRRDVIADLFTEDAAFEIIVAGADPVETPSGRDAIVAWLGDYMDALDFQMRHHMGNVLVIDQSAESAEALCYLLLTSTTPERAEVIATAAYTWQLVRDDGAWRVARVFGAFDRTFA